MHKRRSSRAESTEGTGHSSSQKQRTITDLFSASSAPRQGEQPPSYKRQRLDDSADEGIAASLIILSAPDAAADMYSFGPSSTGMRASTSSAAQTVKTSSRSNLFTPHTGAKRFVVRNLKSKPRVDPDDYIQRSWKQLEDALAAVLRNETPRLSLEQLYRGAENICRLGNAQHLLENISARTDNHLTTVVLPRLQRRVQTQDHVDVLRAINQAWLEWKERLVSIRSIFYYLDQSYLLHSTEHAVLQEQGLIQFRSIVFADSELKQKALEGTCALIDRDRKEEGIVDGDLLRSSIKMFHRLGIYTTDLETTFLEHSNAYFRSFVHTAMTGLKSYVEQVRVLFHRELTRCDLYFIDRSTRQKLSEMMDNILIAEKEDVLLDKEEIHYLLSSKENGALRTLYELLQHLSIEKQLKAPFVDYMISKGTRIVFDEKHDSEMVTCLLELKREADSIVNEAFDNSQTLRDAVRDAFDNFMNKPIEKAAILSENTKTGEMIAKYVDHILRGGWKLVASRQGKDASQISVNQSDEDAEINRQLDQVLELFRFVHGKAVFEAFYKNDLARRLLMGRSVNNEAEKSMLIKLRSECGSQFTHNLETMFKDTDLARSEMSAYNSLLQERNTKRKLDLNVHVLSASAWPSYPDVDLPLPPEVASALKDFEVFYLSKYHGRKLKWKHSLAYSQLKAKFPRGNKEIVVSAYQSLTLLLFNDVPDGQSLSYKEIRAALGLPDAEVKRTLQSLACAHYRVLTKNPKGREVNDTDTFSYNANFHADKFRIKINQIQLKETKAENQATHDRVALDRQFETQAAIVRTLKARKRISHPELVAEVINATKQRGAVDMAELKKNIEKLIEKEYMERDEGNYYVYVA